MTLYENFCWYISPEGNVKKSPEEKYGHISDWAGRARGINPLIFDELTKQLLRSDSWSDEEFSENERAFKKIIEGFIRQNMLLKAELSALEPSGVVNAAVFDALERFNDELTGKTHAEALKETVEAVFSDFRALKSADTRIKFAGSVTGPSGTDSAEVFGYINFLKDCDAAVQWTLFMPGLVEFQQQDSGIRVRSFRYMKLPALRFIGLEKDLSDDQEGLRGLLSVLDKMSEYRCGFDYDMILIHHFGKGVDVEKGHGVWGRFFKSGTPVPSGFVHIDFEPRNDGKPGSPYLSQFAFAEFTGDIDSMLLEEGFDGNAMYDITRNIILGQNVCIPYPDKYWTAEVYLNGLGRESTAYLFSVEK